MYTGEIDQAGRACGQGTAIKVDDPDDRYEGTFLNDLPHGFCKSGSSIYLFQASGQRVAGVCLRGSSGKAKTTAR